SGPRRLPQRLRSRNARPCAHRAQARQVRRFITEIPRFSRVSSKDWSEIGFARMAAILTEQAGLQFPLSRRPYTEQAMRQAMSRLGADDSRAFAARLPDDRKALSELLAAVTIGETYFFREPSQLEYIRRTVLPALTGSRQPGHALRVWSAGCATGEEPY